MDWSLVLVSQGIETTIDQDSDGSGWGLLVAGPDYGPAIKVIRQYHLENRGWPWQQQVFRFFLWMRPTGRVDVSKYARRDKDVPSKWVTRDEAHRRWFETAPHKIDNFTYRFFKCLFDLIGGCLDAAPQLKVPVLVVYAANDVFIPPERVEEFFARVGSGEKELRFFPESYHLLLHDHDKAEALERIEAWLLRRIEMTAKRQTADARFAI